jgi:hypothetical protein
MTTRHRSTQLCAAVGVLVAVVAVISCTGCSSGASQAAGAQAQSGDRLGTSQYLRAREVLIRSSAAALAAGSGTMATFVRRVTSQCPGALRGTPIAQLAPRVADANIAEERAAFQKARFLMEIDQALEAAQQEPQATALHRFAMTVASIRWSNPRLTDLVHTFVQTELQRRRVPRFDVCRAISAWVASGYRSVPVAASGHQSRAAERRWMFDSAALGCGQFSPATARNVLRALRTYQQPGGPTTRAVEAMEIRLSAEEAQARKGAAGSLGRALGLSTADVEPSKRRPVPNAQSAPAEPPGCSGRPEHVSEPTNGPPVKSAP